APVEPRWTPPAARCAGDEAGIHPFCRTLGLEATKTEGGITISEDGAAQRHSTSRSAVAPGCVDFRLSSVNKSKGGEDALRASEARKAAILETALDAVITIDYEGKIVDFNPAAERVLGYPRDEAIGQDMAELIVPPSLRTRYLQGLEHYLATGEGPILGKRIEMQALRADGTEFPAELSITAIPTGGPPMFTGYLRDITERRRAEEALRESEKRLAADLAGMRRLQQVSTRLVQTSDAAALLLEIVDAAIAVTGADMGNIQLLDRDSGALKIVANRGFERPFLEFFDAVHDGKAACGTAMQSGKRVIIEDVAASPVFAGKPALAVVLAAGVRAVQSTPLVSRSGHLVGMLSTHYRVPRRP